jgi:glycosyltransferase involved in cell wall biosynthesis
MVDRTLPLVTIAIPTYNRADRYLLKQAVECSVSQTYQNVEIIVSDNCSTDNTKEVVKSFNDPRIRYFRHDQNIGMYRNENFCVEKARGDFFLLLCDDDMIDNDLVDVCMRAANYDTNVGVILTGTRVINGDGVVLREDTNKAGGLSTADFFLAWFEHKVPLYLCSTLYNTKRLKEIGGFRSKKNLYEDDVALVQLAAKYGRVDVQAVKASFRKHSENFGTTAKISDWCEDSLYLLDVMCSLVLEKKAIIRRKGMVSLCRQNYGYCNSIKSPIKRLYAYLVVYKKFAYSYSPIRYMYSRNILYKNAYRLMSYMKRKMRKALSCAPVD